MTFDKDIPIPVSRGGIAKNSSPIFSQFGLMEIGDSKHFPGDATVVICIKMAVQRSQQKTGYVFTTRQDATGIRVWRIS